VKVLADGTLRVVKPPQIAVRQFFLIARELGTHIRQLKPVRQTLEDTFLDAIGHKPDGSGGNGHAVHAAQSRQPAVERT
jgi:hypothetical protein